MDAEEIEGVKTYVLSLCSAIGGLEEEMQADGNIVQVYRPGDEALACLRDLKKAIRVDNQNNERTVLKALVEYNVVETDIVPLILMFQKERSEVTYRFVLACVELLVPMTWPAYKSLDVEEEQQEDPNLMRCYRKYKMDLLAEGVFESILSLILRSISIPHRDRSIEDQTTIRLVLYLYRNLTAIPDLNTSQSGTTDQIRLSRLQENLLIRYYESDVVELLVTIASNSASQENMTEWNLLVLECIYNFFNHIDPKEIQSYDIYNGLRGGTLAEKSAKLDTLLLLETKQRHQRSTYMPSRHNRFGGTYSLDWDGKKRVTHKQVGGFADPSMLLDANKKGTRVGIKRKLQDRSAIRKVYHDSKAIMCLKLISKSFIHSCFNALYTTIMKDMQREDVSIVDKDYIRYHYTLGWFLEFYSYEQAASLKRQENPHTEDDGTPELNLSLVAGALDLKTILFCLRHLRTKLDKKEWFEVQMAADCFRQMLIAVGTMANSPDEEHRLVSEHIQSNLFYEQQHLDLLLEIVRCYKNQSNGYLKSVIALNHILLKLLDKYQQGKKVLFTRRKPKASKPMKTKIGDEENLIVAEESENEEDDRDRRAAYKDQVFKFSAFEQRYVSINIVTAYCTLLESYIDLEPKYMTYIASMFHRIMVKKRAEFLFWKIPVLDLFNKILSNAYRMPKTREFAMLTEFIQYSTYQFFKAAKIYPLLFVEALFPSVKSNRSMWELPDPISKQREKDYLNDVNYMPPPTTTIQQRPVSPENNNIIDEDMADYLFSAFDRKKQEEENRSNDSVDDEDIPMADIENFDLNVGTGEVDKLLLNMGIDAN